MKYKDYSRQKPKWAKKRKEIPCGHCGIFFWEDESDIKKKKRHFCSIDCYSRFRKERLPFQEQHAYKRIRKEGEPKWIYSARYRKTHHEIISHLKARRYARQRNAEGSHTLKEWQELKKRFRDKCAFCRKKVKLTKDHIIPLSESGTDYIENIQPLCRSCNSRKWKFIYENPEFIPK